MANERDFKKDFKNESPERDEKSARGGRKDHKGNKNFKKDGGNQGKKQSKKQDPFWYAEDQKAIENMASLPWNEVIGQEILLGINQAEKTGHVVTSPIRLGFVPTIGNQNSTDNYATRAAQAFFNQYTQGFTSGVDFEAADIFMAQIAAANLDMLLEMGRRAYGTTQYFLQLNSYYAPAYVAAMGFKFTDLASNLANFRTEFNIRVNQFNKVVALIEDYPLRKRWHFLCQYMFGDSTVPEVSQSYIFVPTRYLKYNPTSVSTGTCLEAVNLPHIAYSDAGSTAGMTVAEYFQLLDQAFNALDDDDVRSMFGAIRRVYSDSQLYKVEPLSEDYFTEYLYHDVMAMQIHNMDWLYSAQTSTSNDNYWVEFRHTGITNDRDIAVVQNSRGQIISNPTIKMTPAAETDQASTNANSFTNFGCHGEILDLFDHAVNAANVLDCTALKYATDNTVWNGYIRVFPRAEIIQYMFMYITPDVINSNGHFSVLMPKQWGRAGVNSGFPNNLTTTARLSQCNYAPIMYSKNQAAANEDTAVVSAIFGEMDRYTILSMDALKKMHARSFYKLLAFPDATKSITK